MSERLEVREIAERRHWDAIVGALPYGDMRQGWQWGEARSVEGWRSHRFACFEGERVVCAAAILSRRVPLLGRLFYASGGPLFASGAGAEELGPLLAAVRELPEARDAILLRASPSAPEADEAVREALVSSGFAHLPDDWTTWNSPRIGMSLSITGDESELLRGMRRRLREHITAAARRGVEVSPAETLDEVAQFHEALIRAGHRKGLPVRGRAYFERLWTEYARRGDGVLLLARHRGELGGGLLGARFGRRGHLLHLALREVTPARLHQGPLLYWEFIRWARGEGCVAIDWGGIGTRFPPQEGDPGFGLYRFKRGFNSELEYHTGYYDQVLRPGRYRLFRRVERHAFGAAWSLRARLNAQLARWETLREGIVRNLRKLRHSVARRGLPRTLYWAAFGFLRPNRFVALARDLSAPSPPRPPSGVRFEIWESALMEEWRRGRDGLPPDFFADEIDGVESCGVAIVDGEVAGTIWIYRQEDASRLFRLGEAEVELNTGIVLPAYRGRGLFRGLIEACCTHLRETGCATAYAMVHAGNPISLRAFEGAGFERLGEVRHFLFYRPRFGGRATRAERPEVLAAPATGPGSRPPC